MIVSARSYLTAGVAALTASAIVIAPVQASSPAPSRVDSVRLSAAVQPLISPVTAAAALLGAPSPAASSTVPSAASDTASSQTAVAAASANNAASDWVISAWNWADYWISYGAELTQYVLGWVWPLSLIGDQAPILWDNFGSPIGDATVYGLIAPVLNDPLNPAVWSAGLTVVAQTIVAATVNTAVAEFNYFIGWILPPLPPLPFPPLPSAAATTAAAATSASATPATAADEPATPAVTSGTGHSARPRPAATQSSTVTSAEAVTSADSTPATQDSGTPGQKSAGRKSTQDADSSSPAGSTAKPARDTTTKTRSTAGSARAHAQKTAKSAGD
ncbi:hypothetical protein ACXDF8_16505 [Mycolicibacterium sp. CBM1]